MESAVLVLGVVIVGRLRVGTGYIIRRRIVLDVVASRSCATLVIFAKFIILLRTLLASIRQMALGFTIFGRACLKKMVQYERLIVLRRFMIIEIPIIRRVCLRDLALKGAIIISVLLQRIRVGDHISKLGRRRIVLAFIAL